MAPEQMHGLEGNALTDQFAWGVLAYEVLGGSLPWSQRGGFLHLVDQILTRVPEAPSRRRPDVPADIERVVLKALAKRPEDRFASMDEVATALRQAWDAAQAPAAAKNLTAPAIEIAAEPAAPERAEARVPARPRHRWRQVGAILGVAAVAIGAGVLVPRVTTRTVQPATPAATSDALSPALGSAMSSNGEAVAAYRAGLEAVRNAAGSTARRNFDRAIKLDPAFAAAHLRKVLATPEVTDTERESVIKATQLRDMLGDHDRALLHAIEPWVGVPQDVADVDRRLAAVAATHADADTLYQLCRFRVLASNYAGAVESCRAARREDPAHAGATWLEAQSRLYLGDTAVGRTLLDECTRTNPRATSCLNDTFWLHSHEGRCDSALGVAQRLVAIEPENYRFLEQLGAASYSMDQPFAGARASLERAAELAPTRRMPFVRLWTQVNLAMLAGNFAEADTKLDALDRVIDGSNEEWIHSDALRTRDLFYRELGDEGGLARRARAFLANHAAWIQGDDNDGTIDAWIALYRGGAISRSAFASARADWLAAERARHRPTGRFGVTPGRLWIRAYADAVMTPEDARDALAALPTFLPLPPDRFRDAEDDEAIGRTLLLGAAPADAIPYLRRAAASCEATRYPLHHTWANLELGQALEATDAPGACAAYKLVFDRWATEARSQSAHVAYVRRKALGCR